MSNSERPQLLIAGVAMAVALVISSAIFAGSLKNIRSGPQTIVVTGSAKKTVKSDLVVWQTAVKADAPQLAEAYRVLTRDVPKVKAYLVAKGVPEDQIVVSSIHISTVRDRRGGMAPEGDYGAGGEAAGRVIGYSLRQELEVRSSEVEKITSVSREVTELINQGMMIESMPPEYLCTKLGDMKIEMLAEAAKDAKVRAQQIAGATGNKVGPVRAARMGVLQITRVSSNEISGYGVNDTTSLEKDITAVVNITFAVE